MKKIILGLCLLVFTVSLNAEAKLLFDLTAQHFSKAMAKKGTKDNGKEGRYNLPNVYVTADNRYNGYGYGSGIFTTTLKTMPKSWHVVITIFNGNYEQTLIRVSSNSGSSNIVSIDSRAVGNNKISINSKTFKVKDVSKENLEIDISSMNNIITFQINGQEFYKTKADTFEMLKDVQISSSGNTYLSRLKVFSK